MNVQDLMDTYRDALLAAALLAPSSEKSLYALHEKGLGRLTQLIQSGAPANEIASLVANERRAFGWSFLSGEHGTRVESAFHALASHLEAMCA